MSKPKSSPKMKALLEKVMGTDKSMSEEEALANIAPTEDEETRNLVAAVAATVDNVSASFGASPSQYDEATAVASPKPAIELAYNVTYDADTKRYMLHTIEYNDNGFSRFVKAEEFARYLPEASHKINVILMDKLIHTMAPGYKPPKKS